MAENPFHICIFNTTTQSNQLLNGKKENNDQK